MRIKKEKFLPNKKIINKYYDHTKHSRSKVNIENLIRRISGLGLRKFQYILSYEDKKKFDLETFENVARAFNREFKSQKKDIKVNQVIFTKVRLKSQVKKLLNY